MADEVSMFSPPHPFYKQFGLAAIAQNSLQGDSLLTFLVLLTLLLYCACALS